MFAQIASEQGLQLHKPFGALRRVTLPNRSMQDGVQALNHTAVSEEYEISTRHFQVCCLENDIQKEKHQIKFERCMEVSSCGQMYLALLYTISMVVDGLCVVEYWISTFSGNIRQRPSLVRPDALTLCISHSPYAAHRWELLSGGDGL